MVDINMFSLLLLPVSGVRADVLRRLFFSLRFYQVVLLSTRGMDDSQQ